MSLPLPDDWRCDSLRALTQRADGADPTRQPTASFRYIDVSSVSNKSLCVESATTLLGRDAPSRARKSVRSGDTLYATVRPSLRRVAYIDEAFDGCVCSTGFCVLRPRRDRIYSRFLYYLMLSEAVHRAIVERERGSSYPAVSDRDILDAETPIPPLGEQRTIAAVLGKLQAAIAAQQAIIDRTAELKAALLAKLFTEGTRAERTRESEIGRVPESWQILSVREVSNIFSGGTPSKGIPAFWQGSIPWASPKDMKKLRLADVTDHISQEALKAGSRLAPAKSIFIVIRGMILAKDVPITMTTVPMAFNQDMKAIVASDRINPDYLLHALRAGKSRLSTHITAAGHGTRRIDTESIAAMRIPVPDQKEQAAIVQLLDCLENRATAAESQKATISELFAATLDELMTGRIRVNDLGEPCAGTP